MSSVTRFKNLSPDLKRADYLRRELVEFATKGSLKNEYARQRKLFFELSDPADASENESLLDWFLFDWFDDNGESVIDHFVLSRSDLRSGDKTVLEDWHDSINSVFEIQSLGKNLLTLRELDSNDNFVVTTVTAIDATPFRQGQFLAARLLPLGDGFIFSGVQFIMPDRQTAVEALDIRRRIERLDSPEAIEKAQQEQCAAFCEFFGCDELSIPNTQLRSKLEAFQHYLFEGWRDPDTGMTRSESFRSQFGRDVNVPEMPSLPEIEGEGDVTILCDEFDGLVLLPDYNRFKQIFISTSLDSEVVDWKEIVWNYIKDPAIPIVAFSRIAEDHPKKVEKVLRLILEDKTFSIEHLYAVLLHYKQPVVGMEELKDDERLWDFFDGTANKQRRQARTSVASKKTKPTKSSKAKGQVASAGRTSKKIGPKSTTGSTARKTAKSPATRTAAKKRVTTKHAFAKKTAPTKRAASRRATTSSKSSRRPVSKSDSNKRPAKKR
jgi:hypothetical protein